MRFAWFNRLSILLTHLHAQGYRLTPQRQLILEAVRRAETHVTPEQVYDRVHRQQPTISRATIYRTLDFLCEVRLIHALYWGGQMYYEIAGDEPHHHLICRTCGGVDQIDHVLLRRSIPGDRASNTGLPSIWITWRCLACVNACRGNRQVEK